MGTSDLRLVQDLESYRPVQSSVKRKGAYGVMQSMHESAFFVWRNLGLGCAVELLDFLKAKRLG
jgi:hypothetical protein